jgi:hypothetical protein
VKEALDQDLSRLEQLAFRRVEACGELLTRFHRLPVTAQSHTAYAGLERIRRWLLVPFTLWPVDFIGLGGHLLNLLENGKRLDTDIELLLSFVVDEPLPREHAAVAAHEHHVQSGNYESLITAQPKFMHAEQMLFENPEFQADWRRFKARFDMDTYRDKKGIIRRRLAQERSFHPEGWEFRWRRRADRFRIAFDAFCHRWVLYGMEGELPLLQKLSVNVTPFGTMIFIPRYLKWSAINKLHRSRDVRRQGAKLGQNQRDRLKEARRVHQLWRETSQTGVKGDARYRIVIGKMGWHPKTDFSRVRRLLALAKPKRQGRIPV